MSPVKKLYLSEMRRIKKQGIDVRFPRKLFDNMRKEFGHESIGYFIYPDIILINPKIKTISARLKILLHEEGHWLDKKEDCTFWKEYRAQRYAIRRSLELNSKLLKRRLIINTQNWLRRKDHKIYHPYYCAAKRLMKTKLWSRLCQN